MATFFELEVVRCYVRTCIQWQLHEANELKISANNLTYSS